MIMNTGPPMLLIFFCATLLATAAALLRMNSRRILFPLLAWLALTGALARFQFFAEVQRLPPFIAIAIITATVAAIKRSPSVPLTWLIGYQAFRIPVEIFLHLGYQAGFVPVQMTWEGRNWDILTGLTALPVAWLAHRNQLPNWAAQIWNIAGFALLLNIMSIAILSLPTPLRQFHNEPANTFVTQLPYVWLPAVLVPAAWFGHIALFRRRRLNPANTAKPIAAIPAEPGSGIAFADTW